MYRSLSNNAYCELFLKILAGSLPYTLFEGISCAKLPFMFKGRGPQRPTYILFRGVPYSSNYGKHPGFNSKSKQCYTV